MELKDPVVVCMHAVLRSGWSWQTTVIEGGALLKPRTFYKLPQQEPYGYERLLGSTRAKKTSRCAFSLVHCVLAVLGRRRFSWIGLLSEASLRWELS